MWFQHFRFSIDFNNLPAGVYSEASSEFREKIRRKESLLQFFVLCKKQNDPNMYRGCMIEATTGQVLVITDFGRPDPNPAP
jgi:hypothetical protein